MKPKTVVHMLRVADSEGYLLCMPLAFAAGTPSSQSWVQVTCKRCLALKRKRK